MDLVLFRTINGWPEALDPGLTYFSIAHDGIPFRAAMFAILIGMIWRGGKPRRAALLSVAAFPIADWLCNVTKKALPCPRPFQEISDVVMRVGYSESMGTASSHAANLAAVATVMTLGLGIKWGWPWIVIGLVVGLSRVYVGVHYPYQVVLGWTIGVTVGIIADRLARLVVQMRTKPQLVEQP